MSDDEPEVWVCRECEAFRAVDGTAGFACEAPRDCPRSDEWDGDNCGHVVCGECHTPLSDRYLADPLSVDGGTA